VPAQGRQFAEKLSERLSDLDVETVEWSQCRDALKETAVEVLGYEQAVCNESFDEECRDAVRAVIEARADGRNTRAKNVKIRALQRVKKKLLTGMENVTEWPMSPVTFLKRYLREKLLCLSSAYDKIRYRLEHNILKFPSPYPC
jgi:hypothetical protein